MKEGKAPFSLQKRPASKKEAEKKRLGKKYRYIFYVQFRDPDGNYTSALSTHATSEGAAKLWAYDYMRKGSIPTQRGFTFERFAKHWWIPGECPYIKEKERTGHSLSPKYVEESRRNLQKRILPFFGKRKMTAIRFKDIREWMFELYEKEEMNPATINRSLATLKVMLKEAVRMGYIQTNPAQEIGVFKEEPKGKTVLSLAEVRKLFDENSIQNVWGGDLHHYTFNLLAATTGMRLGEIQALQRMYVHEDFVEVVHAWSRNYGIKDTKNHESRPIPIPSLTRKYLQVLMARSPHQEPADLIFWGIERGKPFDGKKILEQFYDALGKIEIDAEEREKRNITFHSWRYFFNTLCRNQKVSDAKTRLVMGHKTVQMTERYTNLLLEDLSEIREIQEDMLGKKPISGRKQLIE